MPIKWASWRTGGEGGRFIRLRGHSFVTGTTRCLMGQQKKADQLAGAGLERRGVIWVSFLVFGEGVEAMSGGIRRGGSNW